MFEFLRIPFGLRNAADLLTYAYIDDVLIANSNQEEHKPHLRQVFAHLSSYGIIINPDKCEYGVSQLNFLAWVIILDHHGIRPLEDKV